MSSLVEQLRDLDVECFEKLRDLLGVDLHHDDMGAFVKEARQLVIAREELSEELERRLNDSSSC